MIHSLEAKPEHDSRRKTGRPCKLTPEVQAKLIEVVAGGGYYEIACRCVGITYRTFRRWMRRGEKEESGEFCQFCHAIKRAEAECEMTLIRAWHVEMEGHWQAIATFLERRWPERWSKDRLKLEQLEKKLKELEKMIRVQESGWQVRRA